MQGGLSGFAFGLVATAVRAWWLDPVLAGPLAVFGSLVGQLRSVRRGSDARRALPIVAGVVVGVPIGVWLLRHVDPPHSKLAWACCRWSDAPPCCSRAACPASPGAAVWPIDAGAGWIGGVMGGSTGPAPILRAALRGWDLDAQRAVFRVFNLAVGGLAVGAHLVSGAVSGVAARLLLVVGPATPGPAPVGARLHRRFSDAASRSPFLGPPAASGAVLVATTLPKLPWPVRGPPAEGLDSPRLVP